MTEVGGSLRFVRLALKVVMLNDGDWVDVSLLFLKLLTGFLFQKNFKVKYSLIFYLYIVNHLPLNK
jgi:uncharacterized membrane protein YjjP (DUF1212 family)